MQNKTPRVNFILFNCTSCYTRSSGFLWVNSTKAFRAFIVYNGESMTSECITATFISTEAKRVYICSVLLYLKLFSTITHIHTALYQSGHLGFPLRTARLFSSMLDAFFVFVSWNAPSLSALPLCYEVYE